MEKSIQSQDDGRNKATSIVPKEKEATGTTENTEDPFESFKLILADCIYKMTVASVLFFVCNPWAAFWWPPYYYRRK